MKLDANCCSPSRERTRRYDGLVGGVEAAVARGSVEQAKGRAIHKVPVQLPERNTLHRI